MATGHSDGGESNSDVCLQEPVGVQFFDCREPVGEQCFDSREPVGLQFFDCRDSVGTVFSWQYLLELQRLANAVDKGQLSSGAMDARMASFSGGSRRVRTKKIKPAVPIGGETGWI